MKWFSAALVLTFYVCFSRSARILLVWQLGGRSHYMLGNALAKGLANAGHDITMISPFQDTIAPKNGSYRNIVLTGFEEDFQSKTLDTFDFIFLIG